MRETILDILKTAVNAPSGHNAQPWRFSLEENVLCVYNDPERDQTIYNFRQYGSYIAHGALLENIAILAPTRGFEAVVELLPLGPDNPCVAKVSFTRIEVRPDSLADLIRERSTNRKAYRNEPLGQKFLDEVSNLTEAYLPARIRFSTEKQRIARALSVADWLLFNNREIHNSLFPHILWTEFEENTVRKGLYLKTFELPKPIQVLFHLFRYWPIARILGLIGFGNIVARSNATVNTSAAAFGAIEVSDDTSYRDLLRAGLLFERIWLIALKHGMHVHPLAGILYLGKRARAEALSGFPDDQISRIMKAQEEIARAFNVHERKLAMTFRIGAANPPSARSSRKEPVLT